MGANWKVGSSSDAASRAPASFHFSESLATVSHPFRFILTIIHHV